MFGLAKLAARQARQLIGVVADRLDRVQVVNGLGVKLAPRHRAGVALADAHLVEYGLLRGFERPGLGRLRGLWRWRGWFLGRRGLSGAVVRQVGLLARQNALLHHGVARGVCRHLGRVNALLLIQVEHLFLHRQASVAADGAGRVNEIGRPRQRADRDIHDLTHRPAFDPRHRLAHGGAQARRFASGGQLVQPAETDQCAQADRLILALWRVEVDGAFFDVAWHLQLVDHALHEMRRVLLDGIP